jgi:hypothetical protein
MEKLLDGPLFKVIRDAVATIQAMAFLATSIVIGNGLLAHLVSKQINNQRALEGIVFVAGCLVTGGGLALWCYFKKFYEPAPYEIVELKGTLIVAPVDDHHRRYTLERSETIRATRNNVRLVEHRTHWTGVGTNSPREVQSLVPHHQLFVGRHPEEDGRRQLWIYLGAPLGKGETEQVGLREVYEDDIDTMRPYYRKGCGGFKAHKLIVVTRFSSSEDPCDVEGLIWNNDRKSRERATVGVVDVRRTPDPENGTVDYVVEVRRPKRHHSYGIRWRPVGS